MTSAIRVFAVTSLRLYNNMTTAPPAVYIVPADGSSSNDRARLSRDIVRNLFLKTLLFVIIIIIIMRFVVQQRPF